MKAEALKGQDRRYVEPYFALSGLAHLFRLASPGRCPGLSYSAPAGLRTAARRQGARNKTGIPAIGFIGRVFTYPVRNGRRLPKTLLTG